MSRAARGICKRKKVGHALTHSIRFSNEPCTSFICQRAQTQNIVICISDEKYQNIQLLMKCCDVGILERKAHDEFVQVSSRRNLHNFCATPTKSADLLSRFIQAFSFFFFFFGNLVKTNSNNMQSSYHPLIAISSHLK